MVMVKAKKLELGTLVNVHTISLDFFLFLQVSKFFLFCKECNRYKSPFVGWSNSQFWLQMILFSVLLMNFWLFSWKKICQNKWGKIFFCVF